VGYWVLKNDDFEVVEWVDHIEWPDGLPSDLRTFRITCINRGDYQTCSDSSDFAAHGEEGGWHTGKCGDTTILKFVGC
jgi:ribosomal protein S27AE